MIRCRDVSERLTDVLEGRLGKGAWRYHLHLVVCPYCRRHRRQFETTLAALKHLPEPAAASESVHNTALEALRARKKENL